jgi:hypothetical protein
MKRFSINHRTLLSAAIAGLLAAGTADAAIQTWFNVQSFSMDNLVGLAFSDAEPDTFLVPAGMGTWCTGLGGTAVKCSTEHYTVMEHVLTCHETIPYYYANENIRPRPCTGHVWRSNGTTA